MTTATTPLCTWHFLMHFLDRKLLNFVWNFTEVSYWGSYQQYAWWRHQTETFSALLAISAGNSSVPGVMPAQRPVTRSFDFFFDLCLNKWLSKQSWGWWFGTLSCPLWRQCNVSGAVQVMQTRPLQESMLTMLSDAYIRDLVLVCW